MAHVASGPGASRWAMASFFGASVVFMALKPLLLHFTREADGVGEAMAPAHFQLAAEALKMFLCLLVLGGQRATGHEAPLWCCWKHTLAFVPPAVTYLLMNVLTVRAARLLPPPTFQLVANMKIICTAVVSWVILGRRLSATQWFALVLLTAGVALGQRQSGESLDAPLGAVLITLLNCWLSALGGALTERVLKSESNAGLSIFATNVHMAAHTLALNGAVLALHTESFRLPGLVDRVALLNEAVNGVLISLLMRRVDATAKNYAFSASVFVTAGLSIPAFGYRPPPLFYVGAGLTFASMALYARGGAPAACPEGKKGA